MTKKPGKKFWGSLPQKKKEEILRKENRPWDYVPSSGEKQSFWKKYFGISFGEEKSGSEEPRDLL